jgi:hypothetical protein
MPWALSVTILKEAFLNSPYYKVGSLILLEITLQMMA